MKFNLLTKLMLVGLFLSSNNYLFATRYYWTGQGNPNNFDDLSNWEDYDTWTNPSSFSSSDEYEFNNNSVITLNSNIQIQKLIIKNGTLNLNGKTLTLLSLAIESPAVISAGSGGKIAYSNANDGELWIYGYTTFNLTDFYYPMNTTRPKTLSIRKCTLELVQNVTVKDFFMYPNSTNQCYLKLNGYNFTLNKFRYINAPYYHVICDPNSEIIFESLTADAGSFRISSISSENVLKAIRKTGNSSYSAQISTNVQVTDEIQVDKGILYINNATMTLLSDSLKTCKIIASTNNGYLTAQGTGKVVAQQFVPGGRRVFRFMSNPFNTALPLSQLTDNIDITGNGGTTNGFTTTNTNNASCFYFDAAQADNTTNGLNPGWQEFTSATTSSWASKHGILLYIRGSKGQGLDGSAYTPSSVTLDISSITPNYGDVTTTLTKGANSSFISVGNPYLSPIELGNQPSTQRTNLGNNFYVFDANLGTNGGYITQSFGSSYILPAFSGFFTTLSSSGSTVFKETDKSTSTPDDVLAGVAQNNRLKIEIFKDNRLYDQTELVLDSSKPLAFDPFDAEKMSNFDLNLFTQSSDAKKLAINVGLFEPGQIIPLGIESAESGQFSFQIPANTFPESQYNLTLIDAVNQSQTPIITGNKYAFNIDIKDAKTFENRFSIQIDATQEHKQLKDNHLSIYPNPVETSSQINIFSNQPICKIQLWNLQGQLLHTEFGNGEKIRVLQLPADVKSGVYLIKAISNNGTSTQKINIQ